MKAVLLISLLVINGPATSSEVILNLTSKSNFLLNPSTKSLVVTNDGNVTGYETENKFVKKTKIAKLSVDAVENLLMRVESIQEDSKLIDIDAKKPRCMDAPSNSLVVNKGGRLIEVYAIRSCHRFFAITPEVDRIVNLVKGFQYLTFNND